MKNKIFIYITLITNLFLFMGCSITPSSGKRDLNLMSEKEESDIGKREHPKIIKQFGGIYKDDVLQNYVESLGKFLVATTETPDRKFTFTILDTPIINAFALPGGYIYLTRGLIYLCQNEAQLAGVIAHEIGHVTARHSAKRYTQTVGTNLIANLINTVLRNPYLGNLVNTSASFYLLSYSRSHEYEADSLATRYMIRAGFDPNEMANFLKVMENFSRLQKKIIGDQKKVSELLLTHPNSSKRVKEVIDSSKDNIPLNPIIGREIFLKKIDGLLYGDKPEDGFFYKNKFVHKALDFSFEFDESFYFFNNPKFLLGTNEDETKIVFDIDDNPNLSDLDYFSKWGKVSKKKIKNFKKYFLNNFNISSCVIKRSKKTIKLVTIKDDDKYYRFALISNEEKFDFNSKKFDIVINSFQKVSSNPKLSNLKPPKIKVISNQKESGYLKGLTEKLNLQKKHSEEIFFSINNINTSNKNSLEKLKTIY